MIRQTVAHVDLAAIEANFAAIAAFLSAPAVASPSHRLSDIGDRLPDSERREAPASHRRCQGQRVRPRGDGRGASRSSGAGAAMLACADIEEGVVLRRAGVRIPILVFGALGISDLDGVFEFDLTPTISTPIRRREPRSRRRPLVPESNGGQTRVRPGSDRVKPGSDRGQTGVRPPADRTQISERRSKLRCHLKIDTGMNRLGFRHDNLARTLPAIAKQRVPRD
jgi:alanine racemase